MEAMEVAAPLGALTREPAVLEGQPGALALPLADGWLVVQPPATRPSSGPRSCRLLQELGVFTELALQRCVLFDRERRGPPGPRAGQHRAGDARLRREPRPQEPAHLADGLPRVPASSIMPPPSTARASTTSSGWPPAPTYMQQLIQDLLELSRIGRVQTDASSVALGDAPRRGGGRASASTIPDWSWSWSALPDVLMNPVRARQLFTNLLENAARHGRRDGVRVRVSATARRRRANGNLCRG